MRTPRAGRGRALYMPGGRTRAWFYTNQAGRGHARGLHGAHTGPVQGTHGASTGLTQGITLECAKGIFIGIIYIYIYIERERDR